MQVDNPNNIRKERLDTLTIAELSLRMASDKSEGQRLLKNIIQNWNKWPLSKLNRWLGYAQATLVAEGITTVNDLRQQVRDIINKPDEVDEPKKSKTKKTKKTKEKDIRHGDDW